MYEVIKPCLYGAGTAFHCVLQNGHDGAHKAGFQLDDERRRNLHPSLDDIRRVIREEIEAALKKTSS